jgi:hypothetical protein
MFFEQILVEWAGELFSPPPLIEEVRFVVQVELEGVAGNPWLLSFDLGDYDVRRGRDPHALLSLHSQIKHWDLTTGPWLRELATSIESAGGVEAYLEQIYKRERERGRSPIVLTDDILDDLAQLPAMFEIQVENYRGHHASIQMGLYCQQFSRAPDFTLRTDGETYEAIRSLKLHPIDAWSQKRIKLEGNILLATKIGRIIYDAI